VGDIYSLSGTHADCRFGNLGGAGTEAHWSVFRLSVFRVVRPSNLEVVFSGFLTNFQVKRRSTHKTMEKFLGYLVIGVGFVALVIGLSALMALPFMWLWNGLMPEIFGLKSLSFLQSWGLLILSGFIFKNHQISSKKD